MRGLGKFSTLRATECRSRLDLGLDSKFFVPSCLAPKKFRSVAEKFLGRGSSGQKISN